MRYPSLPVVARGLLALSVSVLAAPSASASSSLATGAPAPAALDIQDLLLPPAAGEAFDVDVFLDGALRRIQLRPCSVRSPLFRVQASSGPDWNSGSLPPPTTYRGTVEGQPEMRVAASLLDDGLHALIVSPLDDKPWSVEPLEGSARLDPVRAHRVQHTSLWAGGARRCGGAVYPPTGFSGSGSTGAGEEQLVPTTSALSTVKVCQLACDADYEFYAAYGSTVGATTAVIEGVVNFSSLIYEQEAGVIYTITTILVRTAEPDPYPNQANLASVLTDMQTEWNTHQTGIVRDTAHLFSGKSDNNLGGIAFIGGMCSSTIGYGVSFTALRNFVTQAITFSHEVGHNWGACHCDQSGCGSGVLTDCHIMNSYAGNGTGQAILGPISGPQISSYVAAATCLSTGTGSVAPTLSTVSPGQIDVLGSETITLGGNDLDRVLQINSNGTLFDIHKFTLVDSHTLTYSAPEGTAFGPVGVRLSGPGGQSAQQRFGYVVTDPPRVLCKSEGNLIPDDVVTWRFGGQTGTTAQVLIGSDASTTTVNGFTILANATMVQSGAVNSIGLGSYVRTIQWSEIGLDFWVQIAFYSGSTLVGTTNILPQHVFF